MTEPLRWGSGWGVELGAARGARPDGMCGMMGRCSLKVAFLASLVGTDMCIRQQKGMELKSCEVLGSLGIQICLTMGSHGFLFV